MEKQRYKEINEGFFVGMIYYSFPIQSAKAAKIKRYILAKYGKPWEFMIFYQGAKLEIILVLIKKRLQL